MNVGLVHIYTGDGKGKTTAAVGLGVRAWGRGLNVCMFQFLKGSDSGELNALKSFEPGFVVKRGRKIDKFTWNMSPDEKQQAKEFTEELFSEAVKSAMSGELDLLILDEVMGAISNGFVAVDDVLALIKNRPQKVEMVLTGRNAPAGLVAAADYVSEIRAVKHPMEKGVTAREGIEY